MQVDYASAALFLNISMHISGTSESPVAWWQHPELKMKAGLDPHTQASRRHAVVAHNKTCHLCIAFPAFSIVSCSYLRRSVEVAPSWQAGRGF